MGTRSVVAVRYGDSWRGRYVHWDGYPTGVGQALLEIRRNLYPNDLDGMVRALTETHRGWSSINAEERVELPDYYESDRFEAVHGIGIGYTDSEASEDWIEAEGDNWGTEWCYILTPNGIHVLEATRGNGHAVGMFGFNEGAEWTVRGLVPWDADDDAMRLIDK